MAEECHKALLRLMILCSLLKGTSGQEMIHVFSSDGKNVDLPCYDFPTDCTSATWAFYSRDLEGEKLFENGKRMNDMEGHERLSLGSECSLNIYNVTREDYGIYECMLVDQPTLDVRVYLHVLHVSVSPSLTHTEIRPGRSVTLNCQLYVYDGYPCERLLTTEGIQLIWVNEYGMNLETDSRYQISSSSEHCHSSLTTTLLNEDDKTDWRCLITDLSQVKTLASYTVMYLDSSAGNETVFGLLLRVILIIVEIAALATPTVILLRIICERRAGNRRRALDIQKT